MCIAEKTTSAIYAENKNNVRFHWLGCLLKLETLFFFIGKNVPESNCMLFW